MGPFKIILDKSNNLLKYYHMLTKKFGNSNEKVTPFRSVWLKISLLFLIEIVMF